MAGSEMDKTVVEEFPGILTVYSDGSITRHPDRPLVPSSEVQPTPHAHAPVATSDIVLNPTTGLWARLSLPQCHAEKPPLPSTSMVAASAAAALPGPPTPTLSAAWQSPHAPSGRRWHTALHPSTASLPPFTTA
ncbi:hypothetical protein AMTR_s00160p00061420 [Amborella trichopoda]|uniref:Uncharacterized protein n=1 Tax=Amborella trichopoda TaxID=13333 RepID=W1PSG2_AMBTC|nr:hypothetical protein AMTR_s00160p00061420 [Amborella trichopoda]